MLQRLRNHPVIAGTALLRSSSPAGSAQHLEVMGDGGLTQLDPGGQLADAGLAAGVTGHHAQQPQPDRALSTPASSTAVATDKGSRTSGATSHPETSVNGSSDFDIHRYWQSSNQQPSEQLKTRAPG